MKILVFANEKRAAGRLRSLLLEQGHEVELVRAKTAATGAPAAARKLAAAQQAGAEHAPRCERARSCPARITPSEGLPLDRVFRPDAVMMEGAATEPRASGPCEAPCAAPGGLLVCLELMGDSPAAHELRAAVREAGRASGPVVIAGERGAGHEAVARSIHLASSSSSGPFVRAGSGAGALGISRITEAALAAAAGGTLYLDGLEPPEARRPLAELLAGHRPQHPVRIVVGVSTARGKEVPEVFAGPMPPLIWLPPLRERRADLPALAELLFVRHSELNGGTAVSPGAAWLALAMAHDWPGNLWELESVVERAVVLAAGGEAAPFPEVLQAQPLVES